MYYNIEFLKNAGLNKTDSEKLLTNTSHMHENVFRRGYKEFFNGELKIVCMSESQYNDSLNYIRFKNEGREKMAQRLLDRLTSHHLVMQFEVVTDEDKGTTTFVSATAFKRIEATNPYTVGTIAYREWQRGFNAAYAAQTRRNRAGKYLPQGKKRA